MPKMAVPSPVSAVPACASASNFGRWASKILPAIPMRPPTGRGRFGFGFGRYGYNVQARNPRCYSYSYSYNCSVTLKKSSLLQLPTFSSPPRNITASPFRTSIHYQSCRPRSFFSTSSKMSTEEITHPTIKGMFFFSSCFFFSFLLPRVERCPSLMMGIIRESRLSILAFCCDGM